MKKAFKNILVFILVLFCIYVFIKMTLVTKENQGQREHLRQIDNWE